MPTSLDLVPSTVRQAAELLASSLSDNEREYFRITPAETLRGNFAGALRQGWSPWEETPLRYDAARIYGIAHPDDISSLIIHWARAMILDEPFRSRIVCSTLSTGPVWGRRLLKLVGGRMTESKNGYSIWSLGKT